MLDIAYLILVLVSVLNFATPLLLAACGELVVEKSGVLNLGVEGMMIVGALAAYFTGAWVDITVCEIPSFDGKSCLVGSSTLPLGRFLFAILVAGVAGAVLAALFGFLTLMTRANQVASGLGLTILGLTLTNALGAGSGDLQVGQVVPLMDNGLSQHEVFGPIFKMNIMVPLAFISLFIIAWAFKHTHLGLVVRAVGENHNSAFALGYPVRKVRFFCVLFGGFMAGVAGGYVSMVQIGAPLWKEGITNGQGWLALALILFATWRPYRVILGALLFGLTLSLELRLQGIGGLPDWFVPLLLPSLPYIVPIVVLTFISLDAKMIRRNAPGSLGKVFEPNS